jgi:hypothetical protein
MSPVLYCLKKMSSPQCVEGDAGKILIYLLWGSEGARVAIHRNSCPRTLLTITMRFVKFAWLLFFLVLQSSSQSPNARGGESADADALTSQTKETLRGILEVLVPNRSQSERPKVVRHIGKLVRQLHRGRGPTTVDELGEGLILILPQDCQALCSLQKQARACANETEHLGPRSEELGYVDEYYFCEVIRFSAQAYLEFTFLNPARPSPISSKALFELASICGDQIPSDRTVLSNAEKTARAPQEVSFWKSLRQAFIAQPKIKDSIAKSCGPAAKVKSHIGLTNSHDEITHTNSLTKEVPIPGDASGSTSSVAVPASADPARK